MQVKHTHQIINIVGTLLAGLIALTSAFIGSALIDETHIGWAWSRGIAFAALILGLVFLVLLLGDLEAPKEEETAGT